MPLAANVDCLFFALVGSCSDRSVDLIITDLCIFEVGDDGLILVELAPEVTVEEVLTPTKARATVALRN